MDLITISDLKERSIHLKLDHIFNKNDQIIEKCTQIGNQYGRSADQLIEEIDAFLLNNGRDFLSLDLMGRLNQLLHSKSPGESTVLGKRATAAVVTPQQSKVQRSMVIQPQNPTVDSSLSQSNTYASRTNSKQVVLSFNSTLGSRGAFQASSSKPFGQRCTVKADIEEYDNIQQRFRYMYTSVDEKMRAIDKHISRLQRAMCDAYSVDLDLVVPVGQVSQTAVWMCGRICCETPEGKINKSSIVLEGSRRESGGRRILLDLSDSELAPYSLFPGQVVLVYGINSGGYKLAVKRIISGVPLSTPKTSPQKLLEYHHSPYFQNGGALSAIVACGPFTTNDNLNYQPLQDLLFHVIESKPDLLILIGPFVDITHPELASGDVILSEEDESGTVVSRQNCSYEMVFTMRVIRDCLLAMFNEDEAQNLPTNIVLVPSLLDAHHEFVFPQPPFGDKEAINTHFIEEPLGVLNIPFSRSNDPKKRVHMLPNPCMFRVNELLFAVCSADVLFSLSTEEVNNIEGGNRLVRLSSHLLHQRCFAPQNPYHNSFGLQGDLRHISHLEFQTSPDIMILPSKLTTFTKDIENTLVINPGSLARGTAGGTFADISVHSFPSAKLKESIEQKVNEVSHDIASRAIVNIIRI